MTAFTICSLRHKMILGHNSVKMSELSVFSNNIILLTESIEHRVSWCFEDIANC